MKTKYNRNKNAFFVLLIAIALFSCKKEELNCQSFGNSDKLIWEESGCDESFEENPTGDEILIHQGNQYMFPAFNPNNPHEFVFYKIVADSGSQNQTDFQLIKYDYLHDIKTILLSNTKIFGQLAWNKNGWIAFKKADDGFIYIIKDDGSELTKFSEIPNGTPIDRNLTWLNKENTLVWGGIDVAGYFYLNKKTIGDEVVTQIAYNDNNLASNDFTVSSDNLLLSPISDNTNHVYSVSDLDKGSLIGETFEVNMAGNIYGKVNWHIDGKRFYISNFGYPGGTGFYEVNFENGATNKLFQSCDKERIKYTACSPSGNKLILQKIERTHIPGTNGWNSLGGTMIENSSLWLLDLKTLKEARIFKKQ